MAAVLPPLIAAGGFGLYFLTSFRLARYRRVPWEFLAWWRRELRSVCIGWSQRRAPARRSALGSRSASSLRVLVSLLLLDVRPREDRRASASASPTSRCGLRRLDLQPRGRSRPPPARPLLSRGLVTVCVTELGELRSTTGTSSTGAPRCRRGERRSARRLGEAPPEARPPDPLPLRRARHADGRAPHVGIVTACRRPSSAIGRAISISVPRSSGGSGSGGRVPAELLRDVGRIGRSPRPPRARSRMSR